MLEQLESLHKKLLNTKTNDINMFEVLGIQNNEVLICRAIGFLLMPDSQYKIGTEPLKSFLSILSNKSYSEEDYKRAHIILEELIDNDRRVDICIYISGDVYPVEVKIWAEDQPSQLYDYYNYYNTKHNNTVPQIYYLTPDKHSPSKLSISNKKASLDAENDIVCLSFYDDILRWLSLLECDNTGYMLLVKQFKEVIQTMCAEVKNKDLISIIVQCYYGNRTGTEINRNEVKKLLMGDPLKPTQEELDSVNVQTILVPNTKNIVIVYDKNKEDEYVNNTFPQLYAREGADYLERWGEELTPYISCSIPEMNIELHTRCFACRIDEDGILQSLQNDDWKTFIHYFPAR